MCGGGCISCGAFLSRQSSIQARENEIAARGGLLAAGGAALAAAPRSNGCRCSCCRGRLLAFALDHFIERKALHFLAARRLHPPFARHPPVLQVPLCWHAPALPVSRDREASVCPGRSVSDVRFVVRGARCRGWKSRRGRIKQQSRRCAGAATATGSRGSRCRRRQCNRWDTCHPDPRHPVNPCPSRWPRTRLTLSTQHREPIIYRAAIQCRLLRISGGDIPTPGRGADPRIILRIQDGRGRGRGGAWCRS